MSRLSPLYRMRFLLANMALLLSYDVGRQNSYRVDGSPTLPNNVGQCRKMSYNVWACSYSPTMFDGDDQTESRNWITWVQAGYVMQLHGECTWSSCTVLVNVRLGLPTTHNIHEHHLTKLGFNYQQESHRLQGAPRVKGTPVTCIIWTSSSVLFVAHFHIFFGIFR